jgi:Golgi nucleoside diphosphatase
LCVLDENKDSIGSFPCYPDGHSETFNDVKLKGSSGGWAPCSELVKRALFSDVGDSSKSCKREPCSIGGVHQPKIPHNAPIYALSFINDRVRDLGLDGSVGFTLAQLKEKSEPVCSEAKDRLHGANQAVCLDLVFIYILLREGYGISEDRSIHSGQKINGYETGWTLGSALSVIETAPNHCKQQQQ